MASVEPRQALPEPPPQARARRQDLSGASPTQVRYLRTVLFDVTAAELCEAKGVTTRESSETSWGSSRTTSVTCRPDTLAVLVPTRPTDDLIGLLHGLQMACIFEEGPGRFVRLDP